MIARVLAWSTLRFWPIAAAAVLSALLGVLAWSALARDAIPDLSDPQIVVVADWAGHAADEVAACVTAPLTAKLAGLPGAIALRGESMMGLAYVDAVFGPRADLETARREMVRRIDAVRDRLPGLIRLQVGPLASSTGWVFEYALVDPHRRQSALLLRRLQDEVLRPALASVPGVAEVASLGGSVQQVLVELEAERLRRTDVAVSDVVLAVRSAFSSGSSLSRQALEALPLDLARPGAADGDPPTPRLRDVGRVHLTDDVPSGLADCMGIQPAVGGIVVARRDADIPRLIKGVKQALVDARSRLPPGVELVTTYDRSELIGHVEWTLVRALCEEVAVVALVTLLFLLDWRSALVPLVTLPLVVLLVFGAMWGLGIPATIMSVGGIGIALGMAVDADVVALEACHRRLEALGPGVPFRERRHQLVRAAAALAPAILASLVISALAFLPVFAFAGESGRLLGPLALTKTLVIGAAALVSLTVTPALRARLLASGVKPELSNPLTRGLVRLYRPFVHFVLTRPALTLVTAGAALLSCLPIVGRLGGEFLPRIDEGDLLFMPTTLPGVSPALAENQLLQEDRALRRFGEVAGVFGKVGRADTATDPAPYSMAETIVRLKPRAEWPAVARTRWYSGAVPRFVGAALGLVWPEATPATPAELVEKLDRAARLPGWMAAWTAPARARMDMMATGVRTPVGLRVIAENPGRLDVVGTALRTVLARVPGTRSAVFESLGGEPWRDFVVDPDATKRHRVDPDLARSVADLLVQGGHVGDLEEEGRRMRVRIVPDVDMTSMPGAPPEPARGPADQLREATVRAEHGGAPVPLALLGHPEYVVRPGVVRSERGLPVAYLHIDLVDGSDLMAYVNRAKAEIARAVDTGEVRLASGEQIEWTGQFALLSAGQQRFRWIALVVAVSMLALLRLQFRSLAQALIVLLSVPFALVGSVWTLFALGYSMSAPVWVGLLSTVGLAMQTGVVMVVYIDEAFYLRLRQGRMNSREDIVAAHAEGTVQRLRPKIMTVATMAASLLPLVWSQGAGAEIVKRIAAPMLGGLATSTLLTLEVLPVLYTIWRHGQLLRAKRTGVPIEAVVGPGPSTASAVTSDPDGNPAGSHDAYDRVPATF